MFLSASLDILQILFKWPLIMIDTLLASIIIIVLFLNQPE
jgi:hypothetical protein